MKTLIKSYFRNLLNITAIIIAVSILAGAPMVLGFLHSEWWLLLYVPIFAGVMTCADYKNK